MEFVIGGLAATSAGIFTNPIEVVKHHMEISKKSQFTNKYQNFFHAGFAVAKKDGFKGLQKGLSPALGAHLVSYGIKLGTYQFGSNRGFTKNADGEIVVAKSMLTSSAGGIMGQYLSSPFYLVKAQHELDSLAQDTAPSNYFETAKRIYREHGIKGFFRGATASLPRSVIGTSQLTSFAIAKECLDTVETFQTNPMIGTIIAGAVAGLVLSMAMTPFETLLSKMYKQAINPNIHVYDGYIDCIKKIYSKKGLRPFYRGMGPIYMKLGPHTTLCLVFWDALKNIYESGEMLNEKQVQNEVHRCQFYEKTNFAECDYQQMDLFKEEEFVFDGIRNTFDTNWN